MQSSKKQQRHKKAFLTKPCKKKKKEENIDWKRLEISARKLEIPKRIFHAKMGTIKDRSGMVLTAAEDIKKRLQEYTEELYEKGLNPDNHNGLITHLEPDIL